MLETLSLPRQQATQAFTPIGEDRVKSAKILITPQAEIVKVNDKLLEYPCDRIEVTPQHFSKNESQSYPNTPKHPASNDKILRLYALHPPIIINIRPDGKPGHRDTRRLLMEQELAYFHNNNYPAILFIHGFNVAFGEYSPQIIGINPLSAMTQNDQSSLSKKDAILTFSNSLSTIAKSQSWIEQNFNHSQPLPFHLTDEEINGTGAHNWFVHMEHNVNVALGKIKNNQYDRYIRLVHIAWPGDVLPITYLDAEETANEAGKNLIELIKQLHSEKIDIYIIAHSLGCRVALNLMEILSQNAYENCLKQVFLWQAAVPNYALTNNPKYDTSTKRNAYFPNAYLSAKKITVLYSQNDWVLRYQYWLANRIGLTPKDLCYSKDLGQLLYRFMDQDLFEVLAFAKLLEGDFKSLLREKYSEQELDLFLRILKECYRLPHTALAMGYQGVNLHDSFMQRLRDSRKLILVNQPYLTGHSAMKIPNQAMMEFSYKRWIVNKNQGIPPF